MDPKCSPCLSDCSLPSLTIRHCRVRVEKTAQSGSGHLTVRVPRKYDVLPLFPMTRTSVPRLNQPRAVSRARSRCHCNYKHQQHSCPELSRHAWLEGKGHRQLHMPASVPCIPLQYLARRVGWSTACRLSPPSLPPQLLPHRPAGHWPPQLLAQAFANCGS